MQSATEKPSRVSAWLALFRPPNLLTVPGDPLVGYLLATQRHAVDLPRLGLVMLASVLFYAAGLVTNDLADTEEDRRERPDRPLPSGRVGRGPAALVALLLFGLAGGICFLLGGPVRLMGLALFFSILLYDVGSKKIAYVGALNMGLCRGFSLLLGAAAAPGGEWSSPPPTLAFDILLLYVAAVTHLAREETSPTPLGAVRWLPAFVVAGSFAVLAPLHPPAAAPLLMVFCGSFLLVGLVALAVGDTLDVASAHGEDGDHRDDGAHGRLVPALIGMLLGGILFVQAGLVVASDMGDVALLAGVSLMALWPIHRMLSRRFHAS